MKRLLATLLILSTSSCATATQQTVAGGIMMGVGGVSAASAGIGLATTAEGANAAGVDIGPSPTLIGVALVGAILFVVGTAMLATGMQRRKKEVEVRAVERRRGARKKRSEPTPRRTSYEIEELLSLTQSALEECEPDYVVVTSANSSDVWKARCATSDISFRCFRIREEGRAQCLPLASDGSRGSATRRPLKVDDIDDDEPFPLVRTSTRARREVFQPEQ